MFEACDSCSEFISYCKMIYVIVVAFNVILKLQLGDCMTGKHWNHGKVIQKWKRWNTREFSYFFCKNNGTHMSTCMWRNWGRIYVIQIFKSIIGIYILILWDVILAASFQDPFVFNTKMSPVFFSFLKSPSPLPDT